MTNEQQKKRTAENVEMIADQMRKKKDGLTLGEQIDHQLEKVKGKKDAISLIGDEFYSKVSEGGLTWYVRRADFIQYNGRSKHIEDEELKATIENQKHMDAEAARDCNYEEFKEKFEDHIEGKGAMDRQARESNFGDDAKSSRSKSAKGTAQKGKTDTRGSGAPKGDEEDKEGGISRQLASR